MNRSMREVETESAMDEVSRLSGLVIVGFIGSLAFLIAWAMLLGWLLWDLGQYLVRHFQAMQGLH